MKSLHLRRMRVSEDCFACSPSAEVDALKRPARRISRKSWHVPVLEHGGEALGAVCENGYANLGLERVWADGCGFGRHGAGGAGTRQHGASSCGCVARQARCEHATRREARCFGDAGNEPPFHPRLRRGRATRACISNVRMPTMVAVHAAPPAFLSSTRIWLRRVRSRRAARCRCPRRRRRRSPP